MHIILRQLQMRKFIVQNANHKTMEKTDRHFDDADNERPRTGISPDGQESNREPQSLTNDESADTDPNEVRDKASFKQTDRDANDRSRFDGTIGI
jgi:hypothetical protein